MSALITHSSQYLSKLGTLTSDQQTTATAYIAAASESIEKYCKRRFASATYDEIHEAGQFGQVFLNNFPLITLDKVYPVQGQALTLQNTSDSVSSASFDSSTTGLRLTHTIAGVATSTSFLFATYPTITLLAAAINGLGSGWVAGVQGSYGAYPSADIRADQYGQAKGLTGVNLWLEDSSGAIRFDRATASLSGLRETSVRIKYSAGFSTIPEPIQQVCGNMVCNMFSATNGALVSENLADYSYSLSNSAMDTLPLRDRQILSMYRDRRP